MYSLSSVMLILQMHSHAQKLSAIPVLIAKHTREIKANLQLWRVQTAAAWHHQPQEWPQ